MPLLLLDALPLILLAGAVGVGAGWVLGSREARRPPSPMPGPAPAQTTIVRARNATSQPRQAAAAAARVAPPLQAIAPPPAPAPVQVPAPLPAADLLVVDDSAVARTKLRRLFEAAGYQVHLANDGVEALALLDKGDYRMLITDLEMPNMDGVTLINTCLGRPQTARMPILAISGHEGLRAKFNECRDICDIHRKPWVDDILLSHVATLVGARQPRSQAARQRQDAGQMA